MNRKEIIKECYNRFEDGYFNVKETPVMSSGNCLEMTGKLLMALEDKEIIKNKKLLDKIFNGLNKHIKKINDEYYVVPRTVYYGKDDPNKKERKKNLWEKYQNTWYRTDTSYSQFTYIMQGFEAHYHKEYFLLLDILISLRYYNLFYIKRFDKKVANNGNLNLPFPNVALRKYFIKEVLIDKHNLIENFWFKVMQYIKPKGSDGLNTVLIYYSICKIKGYNNRIKTMIKDFCKDFLNKPIEDFADKVNWLLIDKIYKELK